MRETTADIAWLQQLLDDSHAHAGSHLRQIFVDADRLSAGDLVAKLGGVFEIHLATLTRDGAPLVAPIDAILLHGKVFFSVAWKAVRSSLLKRDPRVSASYTQDSFGLIVHGTAVEVAAESDVGRELNDVLRELYNALYGADFWAGVQARRAREGHGSGFSGWIEPRVMFAKG